MLNKVIMYTDRLSAVIAWTLVSDEIYFKVHLITKKLNPVQNIISKSWSWFSPDHISVNKCQYSEALLYLIIILKQKIINNLSGEKALTYWPLHILFLKKCMFSDITDTIQTYKAMNYLS